MIARISARAGVSGLLCVFALGALTLPAGALASHGHKGAKAHRAKAKKKASKGTSVTVKCASVGVTCKGKPGPTGPQGLQGPAGPAGAPGAPGVNGASVAARSRNTGPIAAISGEASPQRKSECEVEAVLLCAAKVPLSPGSWTEGALEDDQLIGSITVAFPSELACGYEESSKLEPDRLTAYVEVDKVIVGLAVPEGSTSPVTVTRPIILELGILGADEEEEIGPSFFLGDGSSQVHTIGAQVGDECKNSSHAVVTSLAVDVLGTT